MIALKTLIVKHLYELTNKIEADTSEVSETEALDILRVIAHQSMSKEQVCSYLHNVSRSKFDGLVKEGMMPKGRKVSGYKELRWYKDEIDIALYNMKHHKQ